MAGRVTRVWVAVSLLLSACWLTGCDDLYQRTVADDSLKVVPVDAGSLEDVLRESILQCRQVLLDAGRGGGGPPVFDYCSVGLFFEGCPLRVCVEQFAVKVEPRCPARDSGVEDTLDSRICEELVWPFLPNKP